MEKIIDFISSKGEGIDLAGKFLYLLILFIVFKFLQKLIIRLINKSLDLKTDMDIRKKDTLRQVLKSIVYVGLYAVMILNVLEVFGVKTNSLLATFGIGGIAVAFGCQYIIKDIISGFFMLSEDQLRVGDLVTIDGVTGRVEAIDLRTTKIRAFNGDLEIIQNGNIRSIINKSRGKQRALVIFYLPYQEDFDTIKIELNKELYELKKKYLSISEGPEILGISNFNNFSYEVTIRAMAGEKDYYNLELDMRRLVLNYLKAKDIKFYFKREGTDEI